MNTQTPSFVKKAISAVSAFALVATMVPATALATEGASDAAADPAPEAINEAHPVEASSSDAAEAAGSDAEAAASSDAAAERPAVTSSTEPLGGTAAKADVERISGTVALGDESAATLFSYAGLSFSVNADGATASAVGVANTAMEGELAIPAQVADGASTYAVTNVRSNMELRGGVRANRVL